MKIRYVLLIVFFPYYLQAQNNLSALLSALSNQAIAVIDVYLFQSNLFGTASYHVILHLASAYDANLDYTPQIVIGHAF
jgi:hypothetical protein